MTNEFFLNCSLADEGHIKSCSCFKDSIDEKFLEEVKANHLISEEINDDLKLRQLKVAKMEIIKQVGESNLESGTRCKHEVNLVKDIVAKFKDFDLSIATYALIVNSVINQSLIAYRISNYLSNNNLLTTTFSKNGDEYLSINGAVDYLNKVDKLIIDACEKMHKLKFGEKHVNENVNNTPKSIKDLFKVEIIDAEE
jgi:hypothetical protein